MIQRRIMLPAKTYNVPALDAEIRAILLPTSFVGVVSSEIGCQGILSDTAPQDDETTMRTIATAHDPDMLTEDQVVSQSVDVAKQQLLQILRDGLKVAAPNAAQVKADLQALIELYPVMVNVVTNTAASKGYNLATNTGYIDAVIDALPLFLT